MVAAVVILVVPLFVFTAIDRGWFGGDEGPLLGPRDVHVALSNFEVELSSDEISEGEVHLFVEHEEERGHREGQPGIAHDVVVMRRTDATTQVMGKTEVLASGESEWLSLRLPPGEYELYCSVVEEVRGEAVSHEAEGMRAEFRVTAGPEAEGEVRGR